MFSRRHGRILQTLHDPGFSFWMWHASPQSSPICVLGTVLLRQNSLEAATDLGGPDFGVSRLAQMPWVARWHTDFSAKPFPRQLFPTEKPQYTPHLKIVTLPMELSLAGQMFLIPLSPILLKIPHTGNRNDFYQQIILSGSEGDLPQGLATTHFAEAPSQNPLPLPTCCKWHQRQGWDNSFPQNVIADPFFFINLMLNITHYRGSI